MSYVFRDYDTKWKRKSKKSRTNSLLKMKAYVIAQMNLKSKEGYKEYVDKVPSTIKNFGGEYIVRAGEFKSLEGNWNFTRNVVIKFPSYEKAIEWYNSDEYNKIKNLRLKNTEGNLIIIKGV